ncbi:GIY-YIG nuclease family protein [Vibrio sp. JC009]|uniref:GIY-YIG nuclease family protein n=1 Tax=Vibrio sp. JC009 TaxID=2912314 RepID=UPI0023B1E574|nr:GIY-YIG nuclease family protein [Vibrio sp. JC009]WED24221.1 GIY-YIG nuclease family protein [Vibrio sp. JC009]
MAQETKSSPDWWVYLIRTKHNSLYCGITTDLQRRFEMHQKGTGAKALRGKGPLTMVWWCKSSSKSEALKLEARIKKYSKKAKEELVANFLA